MFKTVLVANRGEIACRIIRTLHTLGIHALAIYSEADRHAAHVKMADSAVCVGPPPVAESYLQVDKILQVCRDHQVDAVHPGYGFLSENPQFAEALAEAGIVFIGPQPEQLRQFGLKHTARELAANCGVPLLPGTALLESLEQALEAAELIGFPVMLKSTAGGGGIGLQLCQNRDELSEKYASVKRLSLNNFSSDGLFLEKFIATARHIEVQIFGDGKGQVLTLGERDCSIQRRNQKVIEETPAPNLNEETRQALHQAAQLLGERINYASAGTVEFIFDVKQQQFYFLEVNTRLQVEHGVTEEVFGVDLVAWMILLAAGELPELSTLRKTPQGASIQVRVYAEDPGKDFQPSSGLLTQVKFPDNCRLDSWVSTGTEVSPWYDPLLAKVIVKGQDRQDALKKLSVALATSEIYGIETNLAYLRQIVAAQPFVTGDVSTKVLTTLPYRTATIEVLAAGAQSSIQDYPGRLGYWNVGVPPSGPMDNYSFRLTNRLVGNPEGAPALEMTLNGPTLKFNTDVLIALGGALMEASLDGEPITPWTPVVVKAGQILEICTLKGDGNRCYLAVQNGFDVPEYLGSCSTFSLGKFGGHAAGVLRTGDVLRIATSGAEISSLEKLSAALLPVLTHDWTIGVLYGPHGAPDFFTEKDIETLFATEYEVHFNSARTGVRLIGPKPEWARRDGGEAGLHPSNIHDNAYAVGTIDFTGDMPIILGPDGPSLGGFVCPATIVQAELWKIGQLSPGDKVRFERWTAEAASAARTAQDKALKTLVAKPALPLPVIGKQSQQAIVRQGEAGGTQVCYRRAGDDYLLVEFGPLTLDLNLRFRVRTLVDWLQQEKKSGIIDLTPGIRSLQIHYDSRTLPLVKLLDILARAEGELPAIDEIEIPSRIVHLPLSWDDEQTRLAIRKYQELVYPDAPWCPSNIEFIRRINGLADEQAVKDVIFNANYMVLGLGDVYLGAPVATPVDPRHRLVTTKYNPARTWTPENAVGIGGAYMCIYGMEGPGGYQFVGRTLQMWNTYQQTANFNAGKPWLLQFFDQIKFFPVTASELLEAREGFPHGEYQIKTEVTTFKLADYNRFLLENQNSIASFKLQQQSAFDAERQRWSELGLSEKPAEETAAELAPPNLHLPAGAFAVEASVPGNIWKVLVKPEQRIAAGETLMVIESMKMELEIKGHKSGIVREVLCAPGNSVQSGQALLIVQGD